MEKTTLRAWFHHALNKSNVEVNDVGGPYHDNVFHVFTSDMEFAAQWFQAKTWAKVQKVEGKKIEVVCDYYAMPPFNPTPSDMFKLMKQMGQWFSESEELMHKYMGMRAEILELAENAKARNNENILSFIAGEKEVALAVNHVDHIKVWQERLYRAAGAAGLERKFSLGEYVINGTKIRIVYDQKQVRGLRCKFIMPSDCRMKHTIRHSVRDTEKDILTLEFEG